MSPVNTIVQCPFCKRRQSLEVEIADLRRWEDGELIQKVWPHWSPEKRELLMTGICSKCYPSDAEDTKCTEI